LSKSTATPTARSDRCEFTTRTYQ